MSRKQKVARVLLFTVTLVMLCILTSMLAAVAIFLLQHALNMFNGVAQLAGDLTIIFVSMVVNTLCVLVLLKVKSADQKIIPPIEVPTETKDESK